MKAEAEKKPKLEPDKPHLLIVEGKDEENLFQKFIEIMNIANLQVLGIGGKNELRRNLELVVNDPLFRKIQTISVIRDADDDPRAAFQSVRDALKHYKLAAPPKPLELAPGRPMVQVMILPDAKNKGALETICMESVKNDPATACVEKYIECLEKTGIPLPRKDKSRANAFISSREYPDCRVGESAQKGYWNLRSRAFKPIKTFLEAAVKKSPA